MMLEKFRLFLKVSKQKKNVDKNEYFLLFLSLNGKFSEIGIESPLET
jgi:hypothetical protein